MNCYVHAHFRQGSAIGANTVLSPSTSSEQAAALQQQLHEFSSKLEAAVQLNGSLDPHLQLPTDELTLNVTFR